MHVLNIKKLLRKLGINKNKILVKKVKALFIFARDKINALAILSERPEYNR